MNKVLQAAGLPVANIRALNKEEFHKENMADLVQGLSFPLVVKPTQDTALGQDVLCNITSLEQLRASMIDRYKRHRFLSIEEFHGGLNSYRVLVFNHKIIGVVQRFPAAVVGDGIHSIEELIVLHNKERKKFKKTVSLGAIKVDEEYKIRLKELNITLATIPKDKETIVLCYTCNSTRGGTMKSLGKQICKENARMLCKASKALNLTIVGFDVACEDILIPIEKSRGIIIEANYNPDITIHEKPMSGTPNQVSKVILKKLIVKHPFAYLYGLYQNMVNPFYIKALLIAAGFLSYKLFFLKGL